MEPKKAKGQKNFALGESRLRIFEQWCAANGYIEMSVFWAGFIAFMGMDHAERKLSFSDAAIDAALAVAAKEVEELNRLASTNGESKGGQLPEKPGSSRLRRGGRDQAA